LVQKEEVMQRVLFPTDFSENSWNAIMYTFAFFKGKSLDIHILHVGFNGKIEAKSGDDLHAQGIALNGIFPTGAHTKLEELVEEINRVYPSHTHRLYTHFESGFFIEGIRRAVQNLDIDLIVMGTKGASGIKGMALGSHAGAVITRVKCTTLIIPEDAHYEPPENIAFPTDFNILYKGSIMDGLKEFANYHESTIKVLRVASNEEGMDPEQEKNREFLIDSLLNTPHSFHWIKNPELEKGLQNFIDTMGIDIIAMVAKNLNFFQRLLFKPSIAKISYHTKIPFLVLHE